MKRMTVLGLSLFAVLAMGVTAATSAYAAPKDPVYKECVKVKGKVVGEYTSKECTPGSKGAGKYNLVSVKTGAKLAFTSKSGASTLLLTDPTNPAEYWKGGTVIGKVTCKSDKDKGNVTGPKSDEVVVEFSTCTSEGKKCTSTNTTKKGTIKTEPLSSELVVLKGGKIGIRIFPTKSGGFDAVFDCEGLNSEVTGDVLGEVTKNIEAAKKEQGNEFRANTSTGAQEFNATEGGKEGEDYLFSRVVSGGVEVGTFPGGQIDSDLNKGKVALGVYEGP